MPTLAPVLKPELDGAGVAVAALGLRLGVPELDGAGVAVAVLGLWVSVPELVALLALLRLSSEVY